MNWKVVCHGQKKRLMWEEDDNIEEIWPENLNSYHKPEAAEKFLKVSSSNLSFVVECGSENSSASQIQVYMLIFFF